MAPFDLASKISKVEVDHRFPLKNYYRSAQNVLKQAEIYRAEKNILELYVLLFKFASLIAETVPAHLEFKRGGFETEQKHYKKLLPTIFDEIERLKPQVNSLVNEINRGQVSLQQQQRQQQQQQQDGAWPIYPPSSSYSSLDAATTTDYFFFDGMQQQQQQQYPSSSGPLDLLTGPSYPPPQSARRQSQAPLAISGLSDSFDSMSLSIPPAREETRSRHAILGYFAQQPSQRSSSAHSRVQYPSFIDATPIDIPGLDNPWGLPQQPPAAAAAVAAAPQVATTPPAAAAAAAPELWPDAAPLPALPKTKLIRQPSPPPIETPVQSVYALGGDVQPAPQDVADPRPGPPLSNPAEEKLAEVKGPKPLHISVKMMDEFMRLVASNTSRNLETCAVLAGSLKQGKFFVTTLILPKQQATSDSCQTLSEEEIFEAQDKRGLFQLGWIHTHPSQSCFMSSIDLHTHYSYQIMLQEAIAIVMAPSDRNRKFGVFRLADPGGVKVIQNCDRRGFHPHETPVGGGPIYQHCAHVYLNPKLQFDVIDLR